MAEDPTVDDVVKAARELGTPEFTRADIAEKLGVRRQNIKHSFKAARRTGQIAKARRDDEGQNYFTLGEGTPEEAQPDESPSDDGSASGSEAAEGESRLPWRR